VRLLAKWWAVLDSNQ